MINKYVTLVATSLLTSNVIAGSYYAGVNLGVNVAQIENTYVYNSRPTIANTNTAYTGFNAQLYLGKVFDLMDKVGLAIQGDVYFFTGEANYTIANWFLTTPARAQQQLDYGFGIFALPEYRWTPDFKVFAGPGFVYSQFQTGSAPSAGNVGVTGNNSDWLSGWGLKIGTANKIKANLELLLSYQYSQLGTMTRGAIEPLSESYLRGSSKPAINMFTVGLRYIR